MPQHDPVSAITEEEATGKTAATFADIRDTMQIPLLTSIWRILAGVEDGLRATWMAVKPIFKTGQPDVAYHKLKVQVLLPVPAPLTAVQLAAAGVSESEISTISAILKAYNRSNGLNFLALTALFSKPSEIEANDALIPKPTLPEILPPLLTQGDMDEKIWDLLHELNQYGASPDEPGLASLWRHLAHWPGLLTLIHAGLGPLQKDGSIDQSIQQLLVFAKSEGPRLAQYRPDTTFIPDTAHNMVKKYVSHPGLVVRMVALGIGLEQWMDAYVTGKKPDKA